MTNQRQPLRSYDRSTGVSASEPTSLFVLKSLLYPVMPVLTLALCMLVWRESLLQGPYFLMAVLAFFGAADVLDALPMAPPRHRSMAIASLLDIIFRWSLVIAFIWALLEIAGIASQLRWEVLVSWAICTPLVLWVGRLYAPHMFIRASNSGAPRKVVIAGANRLGAKLAGKLVESPWLNMEVLGFFDDRDSGRIPEECTHRVLGKLGWMRDYIARNSIDVVYITLPMTRHPRITELLQSLKDSTASVYFVPDLTMCDLVQPRFDLVNGVPVVAVCESPFYGGRGIAKRVSDIAISALAIALLSPVMLAVAAAIRLTSRGPVIFRQKRYGLDGKEIVVYKFRSMTVTEDGNKSYTQVTRNDARVTTVGSFIRATSLDELPQLLNVLEGTMSIVGPRPHAVAVNEQYRRLIPGYMLRHKVKPGITGWAQVNGFRGGDDIGSMRSRIEHDLEYLQHWSLTLDLIIILKTAMVVWNDRHAY
jgi:putative colanic acid biosynthesis UDP-glucose lipid carrier transferase